MSDSDFTDERSQRLARVAALQRMKDHAMAGNRTAMLRTIEDLIEHESKALREHDLDDEPA